MTLGSWFRILAPKIQNLDAKYQSRGLDAWPWERTYRLSLAGLTLIGFGLRILLLDRFPLREDEAIYSVWALHAWRNDFWFLRIWPDKPPLFLWALGGLFQLFGLSQASARWLNIALSTLTIPVVTASASCLWGRRAALFAAVTLALNPFAVSFSPTVYMDPLLVLAGCLAVHSALTSGPFWAGLWLGAAIMTKQQGVLYAPLVAGALLWEWQTWGSGADRRWLIGDGVSVTRRLSSAIYGLTLVIAPILYWDSRRWTVAPSPWDLSIRNYGTLTFLPVEQWWPRLQSWSGLAWHLTASWWVWGVFFLLAALYPVFLQVGRRSSAGKAPAPISPLLLLFVLWTMVFFTIHLVTSVQVWDRYLLPLAPVLALATGWLSSRCLSMLVTTFPAPATLAGAGTIWLCVLAAPAMTAARGELPIGGDHGAYAGLSEAVAWLQQGALDDVVLYHRVLGWDLHFYLYDQITTGQFELRWFPNAVYLADNVTKAPHKTRLVMEPDWAPISNLSPVLAMRGFDLRQRHRFGHFAILEMTPRSQGFCPWCLCRQWHVWPALTLPGDASMMSHR